MILTSFSVSLISLGNWRGYSLVCLSFFFGCWRGYNLVTFWLFQRALIELILNLLGLTSNLGFKLSWWGNARKPNPAPASYSTDQVGPENSRIELFSAWLHPWPHSTDLEHCSWSIEPSSGAHVLGLAGATTPLTGKKESKTCSFLKGGADVITLGFENLQIILEAFYFVYFFECYA